MGFWFIYHMTDFEKVGFWPLWPSKSNRNRESGHEQISPELFRTESAALLSSNTCQRKKKGHRESQAYPFPPFENFHCVAVMYGPVLWSIVILGMALNLVVIVSCLAVKCNASSIMLGVISISLIVKSPFLLIIHDVSQGRLLGQLYMTDHR